MDPQKLHSSSSLGKPEKKKKLIVEPAWKIIETKKVDGKL